MKWLRAVANGAFPLYKVFWGGCAGFALLTLVYLRLTGVGLVYQMSLFTNPLLAGKTSLQLMTPALLLLFFSPLYGLYTSVVAAGIWQAPYAGKWQICPRLARCFVLLLVCVAAAEILFGVSLIWDTYTMVYAAVPAGGK
ncbi:MAG: hypothetical protein RR317_03480 [Bilophila sp.]